MEGPLRYDIIGVTLALIGVITLLIRTMWGMWKDHTEVTKRVTEVIEENGKRTTEQTEAIRAQTKATERLEDAIDKTLRIKR